MFEEVADEAEELVLEAAGGEAFGVLAHRLRVELAAVAFEGEEGVSEAGGRLFGEENAGRVRAFAERDDGFDRAALAVGDDRGASRLGLERPILARRRLAADRDHEGPGKPPGLRDRAI